MSRPTKERMVYVRDYHEKYQGSGIHVTELLAEIDALEAENKRLRNALETIKYHNQSMAGYEISDMAGEALEAGQ